MIYRFPVVVTQSKDGMFAAYVPTLRGCHTQAKTMRTLHKRLQEAIELCLEVEQLKKQPILQDKFISVQHIEIAR